MDFLFFSAADSILFTRSDAESAAVTHEEMGLEAVFPYDADKEILRGQRIGYEDALGVFQVFEIRKVKTLEPDHYQQLSAEHIAVSELTDEFTDKTEWTDITAQAALTPLLTNTNWSFGTTTAANTSSGDVKVSNVWSAIKTIEQNWNVYILPRITVGASGITGRYLDIIPAEGTWRGLRLSLDKNVNQAGVTWDDTKLKTALYGFGQEKNKVALTFEDEVWAETAEHPAKPSGQKYLEDPTATAAYGRNGRPRFGFYQNASITDAETLLEKTWEVLQTVSVPDVTIDCAVADLYRLGYVDVPLRLHDTALVEIRPTGVVLQKEVIQYTEDLLDPTQSRLSIGTYIPNIIYINRETAKRGGGGGGSGSSQTPQEYTTENNTVQIGIDSNGINSLCVGTGAQLNPDGSLVVDPETGKPVFIDTGDTMWSQITQNKTAITLKVAIGDVATQLAVEVGNVTISGGNLVVDGYVTSEGLASEIADLAEVQVNNINGTRAEFTTLDGTTVYADDLQTASITLAGNTFTNCIVSASVSGNVLTLTPLSGSAVTFSKAVTLSDGWDSNTFTVIAKQNSVEVGRVTTSPTVSTSAVYNNLTHQYTVTGSIVVDGEYVYTSGGVGTGTAAYDDGFDDGEAQFVSTSGYIEDDTGSARLRGSTVGRTLYGMLYDSGGTPMGTGSWFMVSGSTTTVLYRGNGTRLSSATVYTKTT